MTDARRALACASLLAAILGVGPANGAQFQVTVDTTPLNGQSAALGFDFVNGGDPPTNSVTISGFSTDGTVGNAYLTTDNTIASASPLSTASATAVLSDSGGAFFIEFLQYLTLGNSLTFTFTPTADLGSPTPDTFLFYILEGTDPPPDPPDLLPLLVWAPTSPDSGSLLRYEFGIPDPAQPQTYPGETFPEDETQEPQSIAVNVNAVPEPGALALALAGVLAFGVAHSMGSIRRRRVVRA